MTASQPSIAPRLAIMLVAVSSLVLATVGAIAFWTLHAHRHRVLAETTATTANQLAAALSLPLWNFQGPVTDRILDSAMEAEDVVAVVVRQPDVEASGGMRVFARSRDAAWRPAAGLPSLPSPRDLHEERSIVQNGKTVGALELTSTPRWIDAGLRSALFLFMGTILLLDAVLVACLYALLRREIIVPLQVIGEFAERVSAGGSVPEGALKPRFRGELERLRSSITTMVELLQSQYAALKDNEELFRASFEGASVGVCLVEPDGRFLRVNSALSEMLGYDEPELQALTFDDITHPDDREIGLAFAHRALTGQAKIKRFDKRYIHKDGRTIWVSISSALVDHGRDRKPFFISYVQDMTDRRNSEEQRAASQVLVTEAQQIAHIGSAEWDARSDRGTWSDEMYRITGWAPARPPPTRSEHEQLYTPESRQRLRAAIEGALATGEAYQIELELVRTDGETRQVEARGSAVRDGSGSVVGLRSTLQDISERSRMEREIRVNEKRFRLLIENASDIIIVVDRAGTLSFVGPSIRRVLGYEPETMLDQRLFEFIDSHDVAKVTRALAEALADPARSVTVEYRIRHRDGSWRIVESIGRSLPEQSAAGFVVVNSRDVSDARLAQTLLVQHREDLESTVASRTRELSVAKDEADKANRAKSTFLATISHEIRTPMNAMLGYAQILRRDRSLGAGQRAKIEVILGSGDHLLSLLNNVLEMSRIEAGRTELSPAPFDLGGLLDEAVRMFQVAASAKDLALVAELPSDLPAVVAGDSGKIRQVVINLLGNALKFTEQGSVILRVAVGEPRSGQLALTITVADTGPGIAPQDQERMFGAFEQSQSGRRSGGAGLGLAICRELARLMGGDLTVRSAVGEGSVFSFSCSVALSEGAPPKASRMPVAIAAAPGVALPTVLVVDDTAVNSELMVDLLVPLGFTVRTAATGEEAVASFAGGAKADLVLMDAQMPGIGGIAAIEALRTAGVQAALVLLTANSLGDLHTEGLAAGADEVLFRPFREAEFLERIGSLLGLRYSYHEEMAPATDEIVESLTASLAALPAALLDELVAAARAARATRIEQIVATLQEQAPAAAAGIRTLLGGFRYEALAEAVAAARASASVS
ncbi:MAG: PAS domain S-box protein [Polyangiaceae bacterium]